MKLFRWQRVDEATDNYHTNGGVVVIAENEERAREMAAAHSAHLRIRSGPTSVGWSNKPLDREDPEEVVEIGDAPERVWVFPDAGCC